VRFGTERTRALVSSILIYSVSPLRAACRRTSSSSPCSASCSASDGRRVGQRARRSSPRRGDRATAARPSVHAERVGRGFASACGGERLVLPRWGWRRRVLRWHPAGVLHDLGGKSASRSRRFWRQAKAAHPATRARFNRHLPRIARAPHLAVTIMNGARCSRGGASTCGCPATSRCRRRAGLGLSVGVMSAMVFVMPDRDVVRLRHFGSSSDAIGRQAVVT